MLVGLSACVIETGAEEEARLRGGEKVGGAVVKASSTNARAEVDTVTLDFSGSKFDTQGVCPDTVYVFTDDKAGADAVVDRTEMQLENCAIKSGKAEVKFDRAAPGVRTQNVSVLVYGSTSSFKEARSETSVPINVTTPAPNIAAPAQFTSVPTPQPAPHHPGGHGKPPFADFVMNPAPPVASEYIYLDAGLSTDDDGSIVAYRWDTDGDGQYDDGTGRQTHKQLPNSTDPITLGVEVEDDDGNIARATIEDHPVMPSSYLVGAPPAQSPSGAVKQSQSVQFNVPDLTAKGVDHVDFDSDNDGTPNQSATSAHPMWPNPSFFTSFSSPGLKQVVTVYWKGGAEFSEWRSIVQVTPPTRRISYEPVATAAQGKRGKKKAAKKKFKRIQTTATMKLSAKMVSPGRLSRRNGELYAKGLVMRGTINGKVAKAAAKVAPAELKGLYRSNYAGSFTGSRVMLSPDSFTIRGSGTILARPRNDKKTLVCLSMKSDGTLNPAGSTWKVIGATGKARKFTAKGTFTPALIGAERPADLNAPNTLDVRSSKGKGLTKGCKALAKHLPGAKRKKASKKKARK